MYKFMLFTFLMLGWAFYELSGGAEFEPQARVTAEASPPADISVEDVQVTRAKSASLVQLPAVSVTPVEESQGAEVMQASLSAETPAPAESFDLTEEEAATLAAAIAQEEGAAESETAVEPLDLRYVAGSWVNMRAGSGTEFEVLETLQEGTAVEVLELSDNGWARLRVTDTGLEGWMAARLLSDG